MLWIYIIFVIIYMELNLPEIEAKKILSDYSGANNYILTVKINL